MVDGGISISPDRRGPKWCFSAAGRAACLRRPRPPGRRRRACRRGSSRWDFTVLDPTISRPAICGADRPSASGPSTLSSRSVSETAAARPRAPARASPSARRARHGAAGRDPLDRLDDHRAVGVLVEVAGGAVLEHGQHVRGLGDGRQHEHLRRRSGRAQSLEHAVGVEAGHPVVDHGDVGAHLADGLQRLVAALALGDDLEPVAVGDGPRHALAEDRVVVGDQHADGRHRRQGYRRDTARPGPVGRSSLMRDPAHRRIALREGLVLLLAVAGAAILSERGDWDPWWLPVLLVLAAPVIDALTVPLRRRAGLGGGHVLLPRPVPARAAAGGRRRGRDDRRRRGRTRTPLHQSLTNGAGYCIGILAAALLLDAVDPDRDARPTG